MTRNGVVFLSLLLAPHVVAGEVDKTARATEIESLEAAGLELPDAPEARETRPDPARRARALEALGSGGILLIPESSNDRVMAFDATTGDLIDPDFVPSSGDLATPINAILSVEGNRILVADQLNDGIFAYNLAGAPLGLFAPAGGVNTSVYDNARGFELNPFGDNYLATSGNTQTVPSFEVDGTYDFDCWAAAQGLDSPFDVNIRVDLSVALITDIDVDAVLASTACGASASVFAAVDNFPEQVHVVEGVTAPGVASVYVANFSGAQAGVLVYDATGALLDTIVPAGLGGLRGVYPLPNGNLLVTNGDGVFEINTAGALVDTKISGVSARFIELAVIETDIFADGFESGDTSAWSSTLP